MSRLDMVCWSVIIRVYLSALAAYGVYELMQKYYTTHAETTWIMIIVTGLTAIVAYVITSAVMWGLSKLGNKASDENEQI